MVNVLIVDDAPLYLVARGIEMLISSKAESFGVPISFRNARTYGEAEQYINWTDIALVDGNLFGIVADKTDDRSGYALIEKIKEENPDSTVFLISGYGREDAPANCPFDHFLGKPFGDSGRDWILEIAKEYHTRQNQAVDRE